MKIGFVTAAAVALLGAAAGVGAEQKPGSTHSGVYINLDQPPPSAKKNPPANPNAAAKPAAPANPSAEKTDPSKPAAPTAAKKDAKKDDKKKEDEIGKIDGMEIPRGSGFMGLQIVNGTFKLTFYDAKKKPVAPEFARAAFRWQPAYQKQPERVVLQSDGKALVSDRTIRPPYTFKLFITFFKGEGEDDVENLTVDFAQGG